MKEDTRMRLTNPDLWTRLVFMILFVIAYTVAEFVVVLLVIFTKESGRRHTKTTIYCCLRTRHPK